MAELPEEACEGDQLPVATYQWEHQGVSEHRGAQITFAKLAADRYSYRMQGFEELQARLDGCEIVVQGPRGAYRLSEIELQRDTAGRVVGFTASGRMDGLSGSAPHPIVAALTE